MCYLASRINWVIALSFLLIGSCSAQTGFRVDEAATRIHILDDGTKVELPIENPSHETMLSTSRSNWSTPRGVIHAQDDQEAPLAQGTTTVRVV